MHTHLNSSVEPAFRKLCEGGHEKNIIETIIIAKRNNISVQTFLDGGEFESAVRKLMAAWGNDKLKCGTIRNAVQPGAANNAAAVYGRTPLNIS